MKEGKLSLIHQLKFKIEYIAAFIAKEYDLSPKDRIKDKDKRKGKDKDSTGLSLGDL